MRCVCVSVCVSVCVFVCMSVCIIRVLITCIQGLTHFIKMKVGGEGGGAYRKRRESKGVGERER